MAGNEFAKLDHLQLGELGELKPDLAASQSVVIGPRDRGRGTADAMHEISA